MMTPEDMKVPSKAAVNLDIQKLLSVLGSEDNKKLHGVRIYLQLEFNSLFFIPNNVSSAFYYSQGEQQFEKISELLFQIYNAVDCQPRFWQFGGRLPVEVALAKLEIINSIAEIVLAFNEEL